MMAVSNCWLNHGWEYVNESPALQPGVISGSSLSWYVHTTASIKVNTKIPVFGFESSCNGLKSHRVFATPVHRAARKHCQGPHQPQAVALGQNESPTHLSKADSPGVVQQCMAAPRSAVSVLHSFAIYTIAAPFNAVAFFPTSDCRYRLQSWAVNCIGRGWAKMKWR